SRSLFWLKVVESWRDSVHVGLFQAAALVGYGLALHLPPTYYVLAICIGLLLTLAISTVAAGLTLVLAHVRFGDSLLGVSRIVAILLFIPVGLLGVPALGLGRGRSALFG